MVKTQGDTINNKLKASIDQSSKQKAEKDLNRYLHFYKFYDNHNKAQAFATKQLQETKDAMDDTRMINADFLARANEQLIECRRVLKYTYVYGYYLPDSEGYTKEKEALFNNQQDKLESFTDELSELCEHTKRIINPNDGELDKCLQEHNEASGVDEQLTENQFLERQKTKVINKYRVTSDFIKNIVQYLDEIEVNDKALVRSSSSTGNHYL